MHVAPNLERVLVQPRSNGPKSPQDRACEEFSIADRSSEQAGAYGVVDHGDAARIADASRGRDGADASPPTTPRSRTSA